MEFHLREAAPAVTHVMKSVRQNQSPGNAFLCWNWPKSETLMSCYDKYSRREYTLDIKDEVWIVYVQGKRETARFAPGNVGHLQRALLIHTQKDHSPSAVAKFARNVTTHWDTCVRVLTAGPDCLASSWVHDEVGGIEGARVVKALLKVACEHSLGPWGPIDLALVTSLDSFGGKLWATHRNARRRREKVLPADVMADMVRVLDSVDHSDVAERELEGATALALMIQHGARPVQLLAMDVSHARGDRPDHCVISYHAAKRGKKGHREELVRDVRPEWAPLVMAQRERRKQSGEDRLFASENAESLWTSVKAVCRLHQARVQFTAYWLRHTAGQGLADAGQSRSSIRNFLGHRRDSSAAAYHCGSRQQASFINEALGVSALYKAVADCARGDFASLDEIAAAPEDQQVGGVIGSRLIAGLGLCRSGQQACNFDPVVSCYGCNRHVPALDEEIHIEAIAGMREAVLLHAKFNPDGSRGNAPLQLRTALAKAQQTLADVRAALRRLGQP